MNIVAYYRVSTKKQKQSGLGLEAQQSALLDFAGKNAGRIIAAYSEAESGKRSDRPELAKALSHAKLSKATLVVAKLDRLSRNVAFLSALMESHVQFCCVDNPHATPFSIHILAAVAEFEAKAISERTKAALKMSKKLKGSARPGWAEKHGEARLRGSVNGGKAAAEVNKRKADEAYFHLYQKLADMRSTGMSFREIARSLNSEGDGQLTRRGRPWNHKQVKNVLLRLVPAKPEAANPSV